MKKVVFGKRPEMGPSDKYEPIPIPQVNHPSRGNWVNDAEQAYEEIYRTPLSDAPKDLAIPFPGDIAGQRLKLSLKTVLIKTMFSLVSFFTKDRGTHANGGVGAKGKVKFTNPELAKDFGYEAEAEYPLTIRHSNASFEDDACSQLRAMAFSIHSKNGDQADFMLSTGSIIPFWSVNSLLTFAGSRNKVKDDNWDSQKEWLKQSPTAFIAAIESTRLAPVSYTQMSYYTGIVYGIKGTSRFIKLRAIPKEMEIESGLLSSEQQKRAWIQNRLDDNEKPQQYLAEEYRERIGKGTINYSLECQVREFKAGQDTDEFFNLARYWDDTAYPWHPLGEFTIENALDESETDALEFWLGNLPEGLEFVKSVSPDDYNSIAESRIKVYPLAQKLRRKKRK